MDRLERSDLLDRLSGQVYLSQYDALAALDPETTRAAESSLRPERSAAALAL